MEIMIVDDTELCATIKLLDDLLEQFTKHDSKEAKAYADAVQYAICILEEKYNEGKDNAVQQEKQEDAEKG